MTTVTRTQEQQLKRKLERQRTERLAAAREQFRRAGDENYCTFAGEVPDFGDQALAVELVDLNNIVAQRHANAIRDIDAALIRIEEHRFGRCVDCDDAIDVRRLSVTPTATRCVACQQLHDRTYAHEEVATL